MGWFFFGVFLVVVGWVIGYERGREDGRVAERRSVRFREMPDKIEPRVWPPEVTSHAPTGWAPDGETYRHYDSIDELLKDG